MSQERAIPEEYKARIAEWLAAPDCFEGCPCQWCLLRRSHRILAGEHQQLWEAAKDVLDYEHHPKRLALSKLRTAIEAPR